MNEPDISFEEAVAIDGRLFNFHGNTHWLHAYGNPREGDVIQSEDEVFTAKNCGLFTFTLS